MRRIVVGLMSTISALVLLFSYHTSLRSTSSASTAASAQPATSPEPATGSSAAGGSSSSDGDGSFTGPEVNTQWGVVQVQITVASGKITRAQAVQFPQNNPRDQEINSYAVPQLNSEVVATQSASIDAVSGATVTSDGYIQSLQSAVDKANL